MLIYTNTNFSFLNTEGRITVLNRKTTFSQFVFNVVKNQPLKWNGSVFTAQWLDFMHIGRY